MRDMLAEIALLTPNIADEYQAAQIYWDAYRNIVPITSPYERQKIMRFMACGAWLECASVIAARAFPESTWIARSTCRAAPKSHSAVLFVGANRVADARSARHAGDALLLATIWHAIIVRATGARKASA